MVKVCDHMLSETAHYMDWITDMWGQQTRWGRWLKKYFTLEKKLQHTFSNTVSQTDCYISLSLPTASPETVRTKTIKNCKDPVWNETFCFRIQSQVKVRCRVHFFSFGGEIPWLIVHTLFNPGLCLRSRNLDVRLEFDLCTEEKNFLLKRKKFVASALKKALHLEQDLEDHEVPVVAVMTTGGGTRALTSLLGNLLGLQKLGLLDAISFITGSSGSTWTLSHLYQNADWSHEDLSRPIGEVRRHMTKCKLSCFSLESLQYYAKELKLRKQEGYQISSVDFWGLLLEKALDDGKNNHKLSDEQEALSQGQNPLPIYMILNMKEDYSLSEFKEWVEFTPYEVGFLKYGAFIRAEDFGSEFFMGRLMKKLPESRICFMKGLWSNVFSYNLLDAWHSSNPTQRQEPSPSDSRHELETYLVTPECGIMGIIRRILTERVMVSKFYNFLKGFQLHNEYLQNKNFCRWKDTVLEHFPNQLTEAAEFMCLADTAGYIDISYPPLMRPERKVDVVLHLNYSSGSQTLPLEEASKYFQKQGIPFPKIQMSEEEKKNLKECYIFEDAETPEAPTVVFFPLVNDSFRKYKEPGVERSPAEMAQGNVDVSTIFSPYCLNSFTYTGEEFDKLIELTSYNIQNNQHLILQALNSAIQQKRQHKK
uniref:Phospholipase A2 n=1 Tax=Geospiza parvula TaxID=87175 RepID=A0A8C3QCK0_GEOPR